jgi:FixJ family two-component response regulator
MPEMTGLQLLQHLAGSGPRIPTVVVTGNDDDAMQHRCKLAGAVAFLSKPMSVDALVNTLRAVMEANSDYESQPAVHH